MREYYVTNDRYEARKLQRSKEWAEAMEGAIIRRDAKGFWFDTDSPNLVALRGVLDAKMPTSEERIRAEIERHRREEKTPSVQPQKGCGCGRNRESSGSRSK